MAVSNHTWVTQVESDVDNLAKCVGYCLSDDRGGIEDWSRSKSKRFWLKSVHSEKVLHLEGQVEYCPECITDTFMGYDE